MSTKVNGRVKPTNMKYLYFTFTFSLLMNCIAFGQKFQPGYLSYSKDSTIFVDVQLTSNNKTFVKYQKNGENHKDFKSKLKDYGIVVDGQQKSNYANTGFREITFDAYYISKETGDTSQFYFLEHTYDKITGYLPNRERLNLYPKDIATVFVNDNATGIFFDGLDLKEYGSSRPDNTHKFLERIINGKVALYEIRLVKSEPKITNRKGEKNSYMYDMESNQKTYIASMIPRNRLIKTRFKVDPNISYTDLYILQKEKQVYFSVYRNTQYNGEAQLKNAIKDFPYLANKIGKPGYQFIDIPDIIEEYNLYWEKRKR